MTDPVSVILEQLKYVKKTTTGWTARCPGHDDKHSSLSITRVDPDGRILIHCHAGCEVKDIMKDMALPLSSLFPPKNNPKNASSNYSEIKFSYQDEKGNLLFQAIRYGDKLFFCQRPDGKGKWKRDMKGVRRVLYRLPEVVKAIKERTPIFVVEGEKDVETLRALGLVATTNPLGAGKWREEYSDSLTNALVVILPDNDEAGKRHGRDILRSVLHKANAVKMIELPGLGKGQDITDWLQANHTVDDLLEIVKATSPVDKEDPPEEALDPDRVRYLDLDKIRIAGIQPIPWIIEGWLAEKDIALLAGGGGIGKSTTAADLAVALSQGRKWCGLKPMRSYRTIYYDEEQDDITTARIFLKLGATNETLSVASGQRISLNLEDVARIEGEIREIKPEVIILDSVQQIFRVEENSASEVGAVYREIFRLRDLYAITFVLVHHKKKSGQHKIEALEMVRGSTAHGTQSSTVWYATPGDMQNSMKLIQVKRRGSRKLSLVIRYEETDVEIRLIGEGPVSDPQTDLEKCSDWIIMWLADRGEARRSSIIEIGKMEGFHEKTIIRTLQHLVSINAILKPKRGLYKDPERDKDSTLL